MNKEQQESKKVYPSISRIDNQYTKEPMFPLDKYIVIQEKLDGSNVTVIFRIDEDGDITLTPHTRTVNLNERENKAYTPFKTWAQEKFDLEVVKGIMDMADIKELRIHGEWLGEQKLPYNDTHKHTFHLFDAKIGEEFVSYFKLGEIAKALQLNVIPTVGIFKSLQDVLPEIKEKYIEKQFTLLNYDGIDAPVSPREGIVVKSMDGKFRLKFVSKDFKEGIQKQKANKLPLIMIKRNLYPEEMVERFINGLKNEGIIEADANLGMSDNMRKIFPHANKLVEMFMEEEYYHIEQDLLNNISNKGSLALKDFLSSDREIPEIYSELIINDKIFTPARIEKYISSMQERFQIERDDIKGLMNLRAELIQDFIDEEISTLSELLMKIVKKQAATAIRNYIESQGIKKFIKTEEVMEDLNEVS